MRVLLTGGAGYIGSHTAVTLIGAGHTVAVLDNFANSSRDVVDRIGQINGTAPQLFETDLTDATSLDAVFTDFRPEAVIHYAGLKSVAESVEEPLRYYEVNLNSTLTLLAAMARHHVHQLVFSSSATVYTQPGFALTEDSPVGLGVGHAYGHSKVIIEQIVRDVASADPELRVVILRYFNPVGSHESGLIGEDPLGIPNNLMPVLARAALDPAKTVTIYGNDYDTPDGTCVRDYVHVMDLAEAHGLALGAMTPGVTALNLGTGAGTSVAEAVDAFNEHSGYTVNSVYGDRRPGDAAAATASASRAAELLGWRAKRSFAEACADMMRWYARG